MDLSHAYAASKPKNYTGLGLVVALHLAGICALSAGLVKPTPRPHEATVLLPPLADKQPEPARKVEKYAPEKRSLVINVPVPDVPVLPWTEAPAVTTQPLTSESPAATQFPAAAAAAPAVAPPQARQAGLQSAGAVCSVMPRPEVPALNWAGEAVLHVVATVRGGRVVGTEFSLLQGALDAKSRRALQRSAEAALAGYQCLGDASFQQDFAFRLE